MLPHKLQIVCQRYTSSKHKNFLILKTTGKTQQYYNNVKDKMFKQRFTVLILHFS